MASELARLRSNPRDPVHYVRSAPRRYDVGQESRLIFWLLVALRISPIVFSLAALVALVMWVKS